MPNETRSRSVRVRTTSSIAIVGLFYIASLVGYWWVSSSSQQLDPFDPSPADVPVVSIDMDTVQTALNELKVSVWLIPPARYVDERLGVLNTDVVVRLHPWVDVGEIKFEKGRTPASTVVTIEADGDANFWPFDTYRTHPISADAIVGSGDSRVVEPAEIRFSGGIEGWDIRIDNDDLPPGESVIALQRNRGTLAFDLGVVLVLIALPALAMIVAVETVMGKRKFLPPLTTWFAAMLFAVVPLRNFLPGAPPPGAWIDQAIVLWVLIALVSAMAIYIVSWYRFSE
ncbi:DUF4436 domain-containing protein [Mycolicibacterium cyprinidarum]|uniref:DUF4436 domain-containing protein n=1 Tax=Mycolicibacterium cyprinidarum TaxID=2860311 RepID=A0ABQ4V813_9MYCO|nr:DUF4436 domain-containing protein [Mycolicibacterium sp. NGTWSNA01]GJF11909.1 DUF4436 domain-containing protein [Mycolicibacterium sp. NGTWS0302]GJF17251.1 DUF4436 domain-containing protein [Mycolicibacterium sp. NGTWS1803]